MLSLRELRRKARLALGLGWRDWADLAVAAAALARARIVFARLAPKDLVARLQGGAAAGNPDAPPDTAPETALDMPPDMSPDPGTAALLARLDWSIGAAANALPWRTDCLIRCLAADALLRRRGLVPDFFIGVRKAGDGALAAHAWVYCQGVPVAGGDGTGFDVLIGPGKGASKGEGAG